MGRPISGTLESVGALNLDDVREFHQAWYKPEEMIFSIAGNFNEAAVLEQVEREFSDLSSGAVPGRCAAPRFTGGLNPVERDIGQDHVCLAFPAPTVLDESRFDCEMMSSILGGGSTSWLFEKIREEEGLAYSIYTFNTFHASAGMVGIYAAIAPESLPKAMDLIYSALRRIRDEGVSTDELEMNRQHLKGSMLMALEGTSARMSRMAKSLIYHDRLVSIGEIIQKLDAVDVARVQACAQAAFRPETTTLTVLGPVNNGHWVDKIAL